MLISALVNTGMHGKDVYSVEIIACFDICLDCDGLRVKCLGSYVETVKGKMHIHQVYCNCDPYITHDELDEEWSIIRCLNDLGATFQIDINP